MNIGEFIVEFGGHVEIGKMGKTVVGIVLAILPLFIASGCGGQPEPEETRERGQTTITGQLTVSQQQRWNRSCGLCHIDGNAGAPRIGHAEEWQNRVTKGRDVLLNGTLDGIGDMPPLGYCMACSKEDFRAMIDFMISSAGLGVAP